MKSKIIILFIIVLLLIIIDLFLFKKRENFSNNKSDILVLIFSCKKYRNRIDILKRNGYLKHLNENGLDYLVVTGDENIEEDFKLDEKNHSLIVKEKDTYEGLPYKVVKTFYTINKIFNYNFIVKSDDDCMINAKKLIDNKDKYKGEDYIGRLNNFENTYNPNWNGLKNRSKYYGPYMNGGTGYILSKGALKTIATSIKKNTELLKDELYEDKLIGDILRINGIKFKKHDTWNSIPIESNKIENYEEFLNKNNNNQFMTFYGPQ